MTKFILRVFSWLLVVGVCSAQTSGGVQNGRLTHDLTVGAAHDIQLKGGQTVQVLSQSASTVVIMVQLSDGSNGVYQLAPGDVQMIQQEAAAPTPAANSTAAGGVMAAFTGNEVPTLSQINSLPQRLSLLSAVSPQNLDIKAGSDEKLQIDALPKGTILAPLDVQGDNLVVSIQGRIVSSELVDPNWNNTSLNVNVAPHTVTHTREVNGRGLIPLGNTNYSRLLESGIQQSNNATSPRSLDLVILNANLEAFRAAYTKVAVKAGADAPPKIGVDYDYKANNIMISYDEGLISKEVVSANKVAVEIYEHPSQLLPDSPIGKMVFISLKSSAPDITETMRENGAVTMRDNACIIGYAISDINDPQATEVEVDRLGHNICTCFKRLLDQAKPNIVPQTLYIQSSSQQSSP